MKSADKHMHRVNQSLTRLTWLWIAQSLFAVVWILLIPGESGHAVFLGYSLRRLALLLPPFLLALFAFVFQRLLPRFSAMQRLLTDEKKRAGLARWLIIGGGLLSSLMLAVFCFYHYLLFFPDVGAFFRLLPLMLLFFLAGIELILLIPLALFPRAKVSQPGDRPVWRSAALWIAFAVLLALTALIAATGLGSEPVRVSIITLGVPLLEGQVWFTAGLIGIFLLSAMAWSAIPKSKEKKQPKHLDLFVFLLIWLIAFAFWLQFPLPEHNYFAPAVRPPTFEKYPFSDAEQYDFNSLYVLFGALDDFVVSKSLYVSFLAMVHFLVGYDYGLVVLVQTAVVALLPAVGYLIGKELHSRLAGGGLALLLILREANAILASTMANVSNSKLLMSDVPATLVMALLVLVVIRWCKHAGKRVSHHVFLLGGLTAMLNLMRIQTMVFIPFILVLIIIRYFKSWKKILLSAGIFIITIALLLSPTLIRNHSITGTYWLDNPASSHGLYRFFMKESDVDLEIPDAEEGSDFVDRNFSLIFTVLAQDFQSVIYFMVDNFARNLISTIQILPLRIGNGVPFEDLLRMASPFFEEVYSQPGLLNGLTLAANLALIALGFSVIWKKYPTAAVMVVLVYLAYNASSSIVRLSGWRFIQPVDWIVLIFFTAGLIECIHLIVQALFKQPFSFRKPQPEGADNTQPSLLRNILAGAVFILFCAFVPLRDGLLPDTYPPYAVDDICTEIRNITEQTASEFSVNEIYDFCMADTTRVYKGYGFYPRYFKENDGYYSRSYDAYFGDQPYARLVFRVVGGRNGKIYIKTGQSDIAFKDGDLVYALAFDKNKADAQLVIIGDDDPLVVFSDPILQGEQAFETLR